MLEANAIGNLTSDPTLRSTANGSQMCNFSIACRTSQKDTAGQAVTQFIQVTVFGKQAESAGTYLKKGSKVAITGSLTTRDYTAKDGTARTSIQITANNMEFLTPRSDEQTVKPAAATAPKKAAPKPQAVVEENPDDLPF